MLKKYSVNKLNNLNQINYNLNITLIRYTDIIVIPSG